MTRLFAALPTDLPAIIGAVLHRSPLYNLNLGRVLGRGSALPLREPIHGELLKPGTIYLAPRDHHMLIRDEKIELNRGPKEHFTRPAIDPLFASAAGSFGPRVVGVLLTGGGADGVAGLIEITSRGGLCVIQDPKEAKMPSMPMSALAEDDVDLVAALSDLPHCLVRLVNGEVIEKVG